MPRPLTRWARSPSWCRGRREEARRCVCVCVCVTECPRPCQALSEATGRRAADCKSFAHVYLQRLRTAKVDDMAAQWLPEDDLLLVSCSAQLPRPDPAHLKPTCWTFQEQGVAMFCQTGEWFQETNEAVWALLAILLPHKATSSIKVRIDALKLLCCTSKFAIV